MNELDLFSKSINWTIRFSYTVKNSGKDVDVELEPVVEVQSITHTYAEHVVVQFELVGVVIFITNK